MAPPAGSRAEAAPPETTQTLAEESAFDRLEEDARIKGHDIPKSSPRPANANRQGWMEFGMRAFFNGLPKEDPMTIELNFAKGHGLIPAIAQDQRSGKVLMLAYINRESWEMSLKTGEVHYWSRSRQELWHKGGTSGHVQKIKEIYVDCDNDTVLFRVEQVGGAACHTGHDTCFHQQVDAEGNVTIVGKKIFDPEKVYGK